MGLQSFGFRERYSRRADCRQLIGSAFENRGTLDKIKH